MCGPGDPFCVRLLTKKTRLSKNRTMIWFANSWRQTRNFFSGFKFQGKNSTTRFPSLMVNFSFPLRWTLCSIFCLYLKIYRIAKITIYMPERQFQTQKRLNSFEFTVPGARVFWLVWFFTDGGQLECRPERISRRRDETRRLAGEKWR